MTDAEGNKPAISLLEEQEQQKRRPAAPSQAPAPYVLPYRPSPSLPPFAGQPNASTGGVGGENSLRSNLSNLSYSNARPPVHANSGSTHGALAPAGGGLGTDISVATAAMGSTDILAGQYNHTQVSHLLSYTQQQLTQLQQVQALLLQHMKALYRQHQGNTEGLDWRRGSKDGGLEALPPGGSYPLDTAAAALFSSRADVYGPASAASLTQISSFGKPPSAASQAASPGPSSTPRQPSVTATLAALGPRPPSGSGAALLLPSPPRAEGLSSPKAGGPSPSAAWPPRPPAQVALKDHPSVGSAACPDTPAPGSPESTAMAGGSSPQQQLDGREELHAPHPGYPQTPSEELRPTSQQLPGPLVQKQAQPPLRREDAGPSLVSAPFGHGKPLEAAPRPDVVSSDPKGTSAAAANPRLEMTTGHAKPLGSHPLTSMVAPPAAVSPQPAAAAGLGTADPGYAASAAVNSGTGSDRVAPVTAADVVKTAGAVVQPPVTAAQKSLASVLGAESPVCGPGLPSGNALTSVFAAPGPGVRLPSTAAADDMRPLAVASLSAGLQPGSWHGLPPPPGYMDELTQASALGMMQQWSAQPGLPSLAPAEQLGLSRPLDSPLAQLLVGAPNPYGVANTGGLASPSALAVADMHARAAVAAAAGGSQVVGFESNIENAGPGVSELDAQLDANRKDFLVFPEDDDDADDDDVEVVRRKPWYKQSGVLWFLSSALVGIVLFVAGLCLQLRKFSEAAADAEVFRWLHFVAGYVPIYWVVYFTVSRTFMLVEWVYFRENLFYLENVKVNTTTLISMLFQLLWFQACFIWLWCEKRCDTSAYISARSATWKAVLCIMLFSLANLLKAITAKFSSMHFYRTAHFKKLKDSLEKEYYLQLLSVPRSRILAQVQAAQAQAADANEAGGKYRLKTVLARRSVFPSSGTLQRLSRRTPMAHTGSGGGCIAAPEAGGGSSTHADAGPGTALGSKHAYRSGDSGNAAVAEVNSLVDGQALSRGSTAPVHGGTWTGFWRFGARNNSRNSEPRGSRQRSSHAEPGRNGSSGGHGGGGSNSACYTGSPPKWNANVLAATSGVSSASVATPLGDGLVAASVTAASNSADVNGCVEMSRASVTVVVVGDGSPAQAATGGQAGHPPPLPPAAPPAPPPPPPPPAGCGGESIVGGGGGRGALGVVSGEPFLTQTAAFFERTRADPSSTQEQAQPQQQQQLPQGQYTQPPAAVAAPAAAAVAACSASGGRATSWRLVRLLSRVLGGRSTSKEAREAAASATAAARDALATGRSISGIGTHPTAARVESSGRSSQMSPPRRLKTILGEIADGMGPALHRRLAELGAEAFNVVPLDIKKKKAVHDMTEAELERIRDAIVIKTYTALIRKHSGMSEVEQLRELKTVKRFAKALYYNLRGPDPNKTCITSNDFKLFFGDDEQMAKKAFKVFDADRDEKLTRTEIRDRVVAIYTERRNMARSLRDTDSIVRSLELSLGIAIHFLFGAIYLTIWGVPILEGFSTFSATVLALTFIFGNSAKTAFESVLFLFSQHPYDVGDMVYFNGDSMRVKRISLLYTDFVKWTNEEVYVPNTKMMTVDLTNWTRTKTKFELHKILVDVGVPWEVKQDISNALVAHCNEHPNDFCGSPRVTFREVVDPLKVYLGIGFTYNFPPDEFDRLVPARDRMMFVIQSKLREHKLLFSNHRINHLEASEELRIALQMRQLQALDAVEKGPLDGLMHGQRPRTGGDDASGPLAAAAAGGAGAELFGGGGGGGGPAGPWQPPPELLITSGGGGGGAGTPSSLPALGAEGLQQRPAVAASAAAAAAALTTAVAAGQAEPGGSDLFGKPKKD